MELMLVGEKGKKKLTGSEENLEENIKAKDPM